MNGIKMERHNGKLSFYVGYVSEETALEMAMQIASLLSDESNLKLAESCVRPEARQGLHEYTQGERDARFCTSDPVQDLFDQLFMQCLDHAPEYANFIKAAEEQHAKNLATIEELKRRLHECSMCTVQDGQWSEFAPDCRCGRCTACVARRSK